MIIFQPIDRLVFYSHLKKLYKRGKIKVDIGLYGDKLTLENVTDEHLLPKSFGGTNDLSNIALATRETNCRRGNRPIGFFLTLGMVRNYCKQFQGVKLKDFDGDAYVKAIKKTIRELVDNENG